MGSSRFPGKMLQELADKPLLWHVIHRLRQCAHVSQIILATSDQPTNDPLADYAQRLGVDLVRGPERNVLERFRLALALTSAPTILRITGDAPLIDPQLIDRLIDTLEESGADYVVTSTPVSDCGIDPMTRAVLLRLITERGDHPAAMEHVSGYFALEPSFARRTVLALGSEDRRVEGARFSIDTPADLAFLETIYRRLGAAAGEAKFTDALALLRADPSLLEINGHVRQRRADETPLSVLIRCDGGHAIGLGHVVRCLAIAAELRDRFAASVRFAMRGEEAAFALVRRAAFPAEQLNGTAEAESLRALIAADKPDAVLLDLRAPYDAAAMAALRAAGCGIAVLDDPGPRRLDADCSFFPPSAAALDWSQARGERHIGFEWIPLRRQFAEAPARRTGPERFALILGGGSDPQAIGRRFLASAARALPASWRLGLVIGAAASDDPRIDATAATLGARLSIHRQVEDMAGLMAKTDLALASFGMTAFELAAIGVPMLLLCLSEDHRIAATSLAQAGAAEVAGIVKEVSDTALDAAIARLAADDARREEFGRRARSLIDGKGAARIAERLAALAAAEDKKAKTPRASARA